MESLEALERLYNNAISLNDLEDLGKIEEDYNIIKQDIERLETFDYIVEQNVNLREIISLLKLRLHVVDVDNEEDFYYIDTEYGTRYTINKIEYDLLKEVLRNEKD